MTEPPNLHPETHSRASTFPNSPTEHPRSCTSPVAPRQRRSKRHRGGGARAQNPLRGRSRRRSSPRRKASNQIRPWPPPREPPRADQQQKTSSAPTPPKQDDGHRATKLACARAERASLTSPARRTGRNLQQRARRLRPEGPRRTGRPSSCSPPRRGATASLQTAPPAHLQRRPLLAAFPEVDDEIEGAPADKIADEPLPPPKHRPGELQIPPSRTSGEKTTLSAPSRRPERRHG
jgi:hypothetical protein